MKLKNSLLMTHRGMTIKHRRDIDDGFHSHHEHHSNNTRNLCETQTELEVKP